MAFENNNYGWNAGIPQVNNWTVGQNQMYNQRPMTQTAGTTPIVQQVPQQNYSQMGMQQQQMQAQLPQVLPGRIIQQESDIVAREVPNDGNFAVFVQQDLQKIYAKTWGGDGLIHTNTYVLANDAQNQQDKPDILSVILQRLDGIENSVNEIRQQRPRYNKPKKPYNKPVTDQNGQKEE